MKVAIVSAGIAGCAAYHALRKHLGDEIHIQVYEAFQSPHLDSKANILGAGLGLSPNGIRALHSISPAAAEAVTSRGFTCPHITFRNSTGATLGHFPVGSAQRYGFAKRFISREDVHRALMIDVPEGTIHWKRRVRAVEERPDGTCVLFEDGSDIVVDLVIGADGVRSVVAKGIVEDEMRAAYSGSVGVGGFVAIDTLPASMQESFDTDGVIMTFGHNGFFGLARSDSTRTNLMWWSSFDSADAISRDIPIHEIHQQLLERHSSWKGPHTNPSVFRTIIDLACKPDANHPILVLPRYTQVGLPSHWVTPSGRIILIGDAAHALPSEGASCAIEDAVAYARFWAHFSTIGLDAASTFQHAARAYEQLRIPRVTQILRAAQRSQTSKRSKGIVAEYVRSWTMWVLCKAGNKINDKTFAYDVNKETQAHLDRPEANTDTKGGAQATGTWTIAVTVAVVIATAAVIRRQYS